MRILVIDYLSYKGHRFFNKIHINTLRNLGHQLCLVGKSGQFDDFKRDNDISIIQIPQQNIPFLDDSVIIDIMNLLWIKRNISLNGYQKVVILTYDIISLFFFRLSIPVIVVNHNNISLFSESKIGKMRLWMTKCLSNRFTHICLNEVIAERLHMLIPFGKVFHVPHGIYNFRIIDSKSETFSKPLFLDENPFVFCPINRNYDRDTLCSILNSENVEAILRESGMKLYIKSALPYNGCSDTIIRVENTLSKEEYDYMIQNAQAVILPYGSKFGLRCSGILFECISHNTHVIASDIVTMRCYEKMASISYYNNIESFCNCLSECLTKQVNNNMELFNPTNYWIEALKN